jgi:PAS domain S-box-containing protein
LRDVVDHEPDDSRREQLRRLAARAEEARREAREAKARLEAVSKSSRAFMKSARATLATQHGVESELRGSLDRARKERDESEESRRRLEELLDHLGVVVWEAETSPDGDIERFTFVGRHCEETLGYPRSRWLRSASFLTEAAHPEDRERVREARAKAIREGSESASEYRVFAADGTMMWMHELVQPVPGDEEDDSSACLRGLMVDATDRKRAEEALRESEERLSLALGAARMGDWSLDLATNEATRSRLHDRIFGYEEMLPEWNFELFLDHVHPGDRALVAEKFERSRRTGEECEFECRIIRADGEERWIWALGTTRRDAPGNRAHMFGLVNDITERKEAEEKIRRSEERFRLLFEQATDAALVHDIEGNFKHANERACESLGYPREELAGMNISDIETNLARDRLEEVWREVSETGNPVLVEGVHRRKDGSTFPVEVSVGRFEGDGEPAMLALARDTTARKRSEEEREAALARERRLREDAAFLADASRNLASFLDLEDALTETARLAVPRVAEWCVADVLDEAGHKHRLAISFQNDSGDTTVRHEDRLDEDAPEPVREVIASGESHLVGEVSEEHLEDIATSEEHLERLRSFGLDSYAIVPLRARGRTFGTLTFASNDPEMRYDRKILDLLENFADRASLALDNARLYGRQRHTAGVLQRSLLPHDLPEIPGLDLAARFHPLGEGIEMGGDFYDLFEAAGGRWSVAVGDVLGKGPEAAAVTSLARHTLRAVARTEETPSRALESLNAEMLDRQSVGDDRFCTVLFGNIRHIGKADDGEAGFEIEFASGGHPLPVILRANGEVEEAGRHGTLLGVYEDPELFDSKARLAPGDAVILYTDGVTEARKEGELFGEERIMEAIASCAGCGAEETADRLEERLEEFSGGKLDDDAAILVMKVVK